MYAKEFLNKSKKNLVSTNPSTVASDITKGVTTSAIIGGCLGLYVGYKKKYNLLLSSFVGAIAASLISKAFLDKANKQ